MGKKMKSTFALLIAMVLAGASWTSPSARADGGGGNGVACVMDVLVETKDTAGRVVSREAYQKAFVLTEGEYFFDDFSTRTRFKFFTALMTKVDGDKTIDVNWFADVTVFNSVDFDTSVTLSDGQKTGKSAGRHTLYTSSGATTTTYSLTCSEG